MHLNTGVNNRLTILNYKLQAREFFGEGQTCGPDATTDIDYQRIGRKQLPVVCYFQ